MKRLVLLVLLVAGCVGCRTTSAQSEAAPRFTVSYGPRTGEGLTVWELQDEKSDACFLVVSRTLGDGRFYITGLSMSGITEKINERQ